MEGVPNLGPRLDRLDESLVDLEEVLKPLLGGIAETASTMAVLDKAKLYVLAAYSLESMLFCGKISVYLASRFTNANPVDG